MTMSNRPSLNLRTLLADTEVAHDESWLISYVDVFVLLTTVFALLLVLSRSELALNRDHEATPPPLPVKAVPTAADQDVLQQLLTSKPLVVQKQVVKKPVEQKLVEQKELQWLKNIAASIKLHMLEDVIDIKSDANVMELQIQSRVLFNSSESELTRSGITILEKLVPVLKESEGYIFVEGHTDDRPIETVKYRSNWELAAARATEVLQFFVLEGIAKDRFRALSYGDTKPLFPNDSDQNRRKNRRVSLMIQRKAVAN